MKFDKQIILCQENVLFVIIIKQIRYKINIFCMTTFIVCITILKNEIILVFLREVTLTLQHKLFYIQIYVQQIFTHFHDKYPYSIENKILLPVYQRFSVE